MISAAVCQKPMPTPERRTNATSAQAEKDYQNGQRALRLVLMKNEIKALEDAPLRCFTRLQIVRFIFENDVRVEFDSANLMANDYLEDIVNNADQFSQPNGDRWKNWMISALRQKSPEAARKAEKKYMANGDAGLADLLELDNSSDTSGIADRTIAKISMGKVSDYVLTIYQKLRESDPNSANRILNALLSYFESTPNTASYSIMIDFMREYYLDIKTPAEITTRYLNFVVDLSRNQISNPDEPRTARFVLWTLKAALPRIKEIISARYVEAQSIFLVLDDRIHNNDKERDEALTRISESKDKLQQAISEAEAAEKKPFEDHLWLYASSLALEQKKLKIAVDCRLKVAPGDKGSVADHDYFLLNGVLTAALKENNFEVADYVINRIEDGRRRSNGILKIAARWLELGEKAQAFENLEVALRLLQKGDASTEGIRVVLSALPTAIGIEKSKAFETVSTALRMANRLPTPAVDDKLGTQSRKEYVDEILLPTAFSLEAAFKIIAKSDAEFAASTSEEVVSKSWRLVADIVVETERKYPLPIEIKASERRIPPN
jgi:hypothetical protein